MKTNRVLPSVACALLLAPLSASAITRTWDGGGADDNWGTAANWNPDGAPANGDDLTFGTAVPGTTTNNLTGRTFERLSFLRGTTVAGNAFTLTGGVDANPLTGGNAIVTANLTLGANQTFNVDRNTLALNGSVGFGARVLTVTGGGALEFNSLAGSSTAGAKLIKNGSGRLTVASPAIVFMPAMDFTAGTLQVLGSLQTTVSMTGGKLTGDGQLTGLNATAGDIEPAVAGLRVSGNTTLGGAARCVFHLAAAGDANSLDVTSGSVTLNGGSLVLDVTGVTPPHGASYVLLSKTSAGAVTGTFAGMPEGTEIQVGSSVGRLSYTGGNGNDVVLTIISATQTWDGGATLNDNWNDAQNWLSNTAPQAGDILVFPDGIGSTDRGMDNNFPNDTVFRQLVFNGDDFTVRGNRFKLSHGMKFGVLALQTNLDTSVSLTRDQTFLFEATSLPLAVLHLDQLDEIVSAGHILTLSGYGRFGGNFSGTGGILVAAGAKAVLSSNSTYSGETTVETGADLIADIAVTGSPLGTPAGRTSVSGSLILDTAGSINLFNSTDEPFVLHSGAHLDEEGQFDLELKGTVELSGPGDMHISGTGAHLNGDRMRVSGEIRGVGDLEFLPSQVGLEKTIELIGPVSNTFTGSLRVTGCTLIADKSNPGVLSVPCGDLFIGQGDPANPGGLLETRQHEQIADTCHVHVENGGELDIGNVIARTETIRDLRVARGGKVFGAGDSLLVVKGNISAVKGDGTDPAISFLPIQITGAPCVLDVASGAELHFTASGVVSRTGSGTILKTGPGGLTIVKLDAVPIEITAGSVTLEQAAQCPVFLNGGALFGNAGKTETGPVSSLAGGGAIGGTVKTGSCTFNAATTFKGLIQGVTASPPNAELIVTGAVALNGASLELDDRSPPIPDGTHLTIISNDGSDAVSGIFAGLPEGTFIPFDGAGFTISYHGGDGNDVVLTAAQTPPVEVPPTVTTLTLGNPDGIGTRAVTIAGKGTPGASYKLESSVDLQQWTPTGAAQTANAATGALSFSTIANLPVNPIKFWRFRKL